MGCGADWAEWCIETVICAGSTGPSESPGAVHTIAGLGTVGTESYPDIPQRHWLHSAREQTRGNDHNCYACRHTRDEYGAAAHHH